MEGLVPDPLQSSLSWLRNFRQVVLLCKSSFYVFVSFETRFLYSSGCPGLLLGAGTKGLCYHAEKFQFLKLCFTVTPHPCRVIQLGDSVSSRDPQITSASSLGQCGLPRRLHSGLGKVEAALCPQSAP